MKAVVAAFNQEKALVGAFFVIVQLHRLIVYSTSTYLANSRCPMLWTLSSSRTRRESPSVSSAWPADFSMLYRSISCSRASIGSDFGILEAEESSGGSTGAAL